MGNPKVVLINYVLDTFSLVITDVFCRWIWHFVHGLNFEILLGIIRLVGSAIFVILPNTRHNFIDFFLFNHLLLFVLCWGKLTTTVTIPVLKLIGEDKIIKPFVQLSRLFKLVWELSFGVICVRCERPLLNLTSLVSTSKTHDVLTDCVALIKILVRGAGHCFLVETGRLGSITFLFFVVRLLDSLTQRDGGTLRSHFVVLGLHDGVDILVRGYIILLTLRCVLEATHGVVEIFSCPVHGLLLSHLNTVKIISFLGVLSVSCLHMSECQLRTLVKLWNNLSRLVWVRNWCDLLFYLLVINTLWSRVLNSHLKIDVF